MRELIEGDKIILRKYEISFAPLLYEAAHESRGGEFTRWMSWCHENYTFAESLAFVQADVEAWKIGKNYGYAVFERKTGDFLGGVGINQYNVQHKFFNLGYWIRVSRQNCGFASQATGLLAQTSFKVLPINRLEIVIAAENKASIKAAEKSGATREGILRNRLLVGDSIHDAVMFSFVREDF